MAKQEDEDDTDAGPDAGSKRVSAEDLRNFAHEVRTPLNALLGYAELIRAECATDAADVAKIENYAATVEAAGTQLLRLCDRMLATDGLASQVDLVPVDIARVLEKVVEMFAGIARRRGITLTFTAASDFPEVASDPVLLTEIVTNLVNNALKFTPSGGRVEVMAELDRHDNAVIVVISDSGKGIPPDVLAKIREGKRVTTPSLDGQLGWGRGLVVTQQLCRLLGTELDIAQKQDGGTLISFRQPLAR
jgi:two-component system, cell cycle sensor histidine kinase PleC